MEIKGSIESVVYQNNETGYAIVKIKTDENKMITATGKFPIMGEGEQVVVDGLTKIHPKYGEQLVCSKIEIIKPTTAEQIEKYLASGLISGVGPVTANNIVKMFGAETLEIIETKPMELARVRGVSAEKAMMIALRYADIKKLQNAVMFLQSYDVSVNMAVKIYDKYKSGTEAILSKNPYKLVEDIDGVGFKTADKIAIKMGIEPDSTFRMRAAIIYLLGEIATKTGSTIVNTLELSEEVFALLGVNPDLKRDAYEQVVADLIIDGFIIEHIEGEDVFLALQKYYAMEKSIAGRLVKLLLGSSSTKQDISFYLDEYERMAGITLHESQRNAINTAVNNGVVVITGGPGTGKTTIVRAINNILKAMGHETLLLAPTGRASKRLSEATGDDAKTIHRALDINFKGKEYESAFDPATELDADAIIVDECSMVDTYVMSNIMNALSAGKRLILVGDKDQLPSVGAGNILGDLIALDLVPVVQLTQIFRQAQESQIVINAHKINSGENLEITKSGDFFIMNKATPEENRELIVDLVSKRLPAFLGVDASQVQVLAALKSGELGVENLNQNLQAVLNPESGTKQELIVGGKKFRVGDRVMQTVNNYDKEWLRGIETGKGVFNGDIGYIEEISQVASETMVLFEDGRRCHYTISDLDELILSYAITIHKSQGSEFDAVVIPVVGGNPMMMTRNLLYTGVTRAKKMVVLVGSLSNISYMIHNAYSFKRKTLLKELIKEEYAKLSMLGI